MALNSYLTLRAPIESALTSFRPTHAYIDTEFQKVSTHDKGGHRFSNASEDAVIVEFGKGMFRASEDVTMAFLAPGGLGYEPAGQVY